jgi:hypothetical protein
MAISNNLAAHIAATYANGEIVSEMQSALASGANVMAAPRIAIASGAINPASDYRMLLNSASGSPVLSLPAGVNGQTFALAYHPSNTQTWSLAPNGSDVLASNVSSAMSSKTPVNVQHLNGTWFAV